MSTTLCTSACAPIVRVVAGAAIALAVVSLWTAWRMRLSLSGGDQSKPWHLPLAYSMLGFWVLIPPVWFFFEFQFLHPLIYTGDDSASVELSRLKHAQDLASKIWLALVVTLAALMNIKWPPGLDAQHNPQQGQTQDSKAQQSVAADRHEGAAAAER